MWPFNKPVSTNTSVDTARGWIHAAYVYDIGGKSCSFRCPTDEDVPAHQPFAGLHQWFTSQPEQPTYEMLVDTGSIVFVRSVIVRIEFYRYNK